MTSPFLTFSKFFPLQPPLTDLFRRLATCLFFLLAFSQSFWCLTELYKIGFMCESQTNKTPSYAVRILPSHPQRARHACVSTVDHFQISSYLWPSLSFSWVSWSGRHRYSTALMGKPRPWEFGGTSSPALSFPCSLLWGQTLPSYHVALGIHRDPTAGLSTVSFISPSLSVAQDNRGECSQGCSQRMHRPQQQIEVCAVSSLGRQKAEAGSQVAPGASVVCTGYTSSRGSINGTNLHVSKCKRNV